MPSHRGVTCNVKTDNGIVKEWGVNHLKGGTSSSCFIVAETGARFRIHLKPELPFDYAHWRDCDGTSESEASSSNSGSGASSKHSSTSSISSSRWLRSNSETPPPFHLLATVYLDGRKRPERRSIVYLDPDHEQFDAKMSGTISLKTTLMEGRDGQIHEYLWMFGEVGLDRFLTDLSINRRKKNASAQDYAPAPVNDEAELLNAFGNASLERVDAEERKQVGKIVVTLSRIIVGERWQAPHYRVKRQEGEDEDVDMTEIKKVSHTTEFRAGVVVHRTVPCISFSPYVRGEGNFAEFTFFYRDQDILRRFGWPGFPLPPLPKACLAPGAVSRRTRSSVTTSINSLNPLPGTARSSQANKKRSTSRPVQSSRVTQRPEPPASGAGDGTSDDSDDEAAQSTEVQSAISSPHSSFRSLKVPAVTSKRSLKVQPPPPHTRASTGRHSDGDDDDSEASTSINTSFPSSSSQARARAPSPTDTLITSFSVSTAQQRQAREIWAKQHGLPYRPGSSSITHPYNTRQNAAAASQANGAPHITKQDEDLPPLHSTDRKRTRARSEELASPPPLSLSDPATIDVGSGSSRTKRHKSLTPDEPNRGRRPRRRSSAAQRVDDERRALRNRRSASVGAEAENANRGQGWTGGYDANMEDGEHAGNSAGVPGLMITPASEP